MIGKSFGRWFVLKEDGRRHRAVMYLCRCSCGTERRISGTSLRRGITSSCGCIKKEKMTRHGKSKSIAYKIWNGMMMRCSNPNNAKHKYYGKRGISVCKEWHDFVNFYKDMGDRPSPKHQIDRIDNNKGYSKSNCRWVTSKQNNDNRRNSRIIEYLGKSQSIKDWCNELNIDYAKACYRYRAGKTPEEIFK